MASEREKFIDEIRLIDGLSNAILCGITIVKREKSAEFFLVTDKTYTQAEQTKALSICQSYLPQGVTAQVKIVKRVPDKKALKDRIYEYIKRTYPAAAAFLDEENIEVEMLSSGAHFYVDIASGEQTLFSSGNILDEVSKYLSSGYCGSFYGNVRIIEKVRDESVLNEIAETQEEEIIPLEIRRFPICEYKKIDGMDELIENAVYMADSGNVEGTFALCGKISYIEEIAYTKHNEKTGEDVEKTRFSINFTDESGSIRTTYFPKKATVELVRTLKAGDSIMIIGSNEEYRGSVSFKASKINYGSAPEGFAPIARKGKPVPQYYHTVFPEPYVDYEQAGLFDNLDKPNDLKQNTFVVFDLETTGLNNNPAMGKMDKIIEIGAVKISGGEIVEKFSSFVACNEKLSSEIVSLTGITDEDLIGAPEVDKVLADFYKFTDGAMLVGHNVTFDYRFVQYYGEKEGYMFDKKQYDTLTLAQEVLRGMLSNYKLNTVADYYGFEFNHHRAFEDAAVTAKVFIELVKAKGKL